MTDESGPDGKIIAIPGDKLCRMYRHAQSLDDLPEMILLQISHFFEHYKDLEDNKWVKIEGWGDVQAAREEIMSSIARFQDAPVKPHF
jgi:inorganic pyrophosphatase